ncbi:MAG: YfbR-like 5'-deoxynucleotidase [Candidatus Dojkabacteria bacterium]
MKIPENIEQFKENPDGSLLNFLTTTTTSLAQIHRCATMPVQRPENVLEHSAMVGIISFLLAADIPEADPYVAAAKGLFHDYEEAITGDICRDFKYLDPEFRKALAKVEPAAIFSIAKRLPTKKLLLYFYDTWHDAKDDSIEGRIVSIADSIAMMVYIYEEVLRGNTWLIYEPWDLAYPTAMEKLKAYKFPKNGLAARTLQEFQDWREKLAIPPR